MSDPMEGRTPDGMQLTPQQLDELFRKGYWDHAIRYGIQYYVAGRFAAASGFTPVLANLLHHAVELFLKACLAYDDSAEKIRKYGATKGGYRHDLPLLWSEFKKRNPTIVHSEFDSVIDTLHKFEDIRYPEQLIADGGTIVIDIFPNEDHGNGLLRDDQPLYVLKLPQIDELMGILFEATHCNRELFLAEVRDERRQLYYEKMATTLFGRTKSQ